jgi:hypothetical protein
MVWGQPPETFAWVILGDLDKTATVQQIGTEISKKKLAFFSRRPAQYLQLC